MKVEAKDLVVGNEYWFNEFKQGSGVYLGVDSTGSSCFTTENRAYYCRRYSKEFKREIVGFPYPCNMYLKTDNTKEGLLTKAQQQIEEAKKQIAEANELIERANEMIKQNDEDIYFDLTKFQLKPFRDDQAKAAGFLDLNFFQVRIDYEYKGKSFFLSNNYNWEIKSDSGGELCLIPTKKK